MSILILTGYIILDLITGLLVVSVLLYMRELFYKEKVFDNKTKRKMLIYGTIAWIILGLFFELIYRV